MEESKRRYEKLQDFQLNDAPHSVIDALYATYQSRTYSCCLRFFCCCCVPGVEEFTAESLRQSGETVLADLVEALEKIKVAKPNSQRLRYLQSNPQALLQGEIQKTKTLIKGVKNKTLYRGLHEDYISAITNIQDPIFEVDDPKELHDAESIDSFEADL